MDIQKNNSKKQVRSNNSLRVQKATVDNCISKGSSESLATVIFPWSKWQKPQRFVSTSDGNDDDQHVSFFLCLTSVLLLVINYVCTLIFLSVNTYIFQSLGILVTTLTIWITVHRAAYAYLTDGIIYFGTAAFIFCPGLLCFPCSWISCISHNNKKNYVFFPLVCRFVRTF